MSRCCSWHRVVASCRVTTRSAGGVTPRQGGALTGEGRGCAGLGKPEAGCCHAVRVRWAGGGEHDRPVLACVPSWAVFVRWRSGSRGVCGGAGSRGARKVEPWPRSGETSMVWWCPCAGSSRMTKVAAGSVQLAAAMAVCDPGWPSATCVPGACAGARRKASAARWGVWLACSVVGHRKVVKQPVFCALRWARRREEGRAAVVAADAVHGTTVAASLDSGLRLG